MSLYLLVYNSVKLRSSILENNEIYATQQLTGNARTDIKSGLYKVKNDAFNGGQILEVGGQYFNRFAIVKN